MMNTVNTDRACGDTAVGSRDVASRLLIDPPQPLDTSP